MHGASGRCSHKRNKSTIETKPKLKRKEYEKELQRVQAELCKLQEWVKYKGLRVIIVFEGRDGAGKGGTIKAITERATECSIPQTPPLPHGTLCDPTTRDVPVSTASRIY